MGISKVLPRTHRHGHHTSRMLALGVAGTAFQGFQISKAFKGFGSSFDGACPSTPVPFGVACGMRITTVAAASCDDVLVEINARVNGQSGVWHDPHNNGTYAKCVPAPATHSAYIPPPEGAPSEGTPTPDPKPDPNHRPHHPAEQRRPEGVPQGVAGLPLHLSRRRLTSLLYRETLSV